MRYVTLDELVQIGIFLIALIGLVIKICFIRVIGQKVLMANPNH